VEDEKESEVGYSPETLEPGEAGLFCFLDQDRVCAATCMAYMTSASEPSKTPLSQAQQRCSILSSAEQAARHVVIVASVLASSEKRKKTELADKKREANMPTPLGAAPKNPFGSRT
jgi:uncharacterized protein (DUF3084 family)